VISLRPWCLAVALGLLAPGSARAQAGPDSSLAVSGPTPAAWVAAALESLDTARGRFVTAAVVGDTAAMAASARTREAGLDILDRSSDTPELLLELSWPIRISWIEAALRERRSDWVRVLLEVLDGRPPEAGSPSRGPAALVLGLGARSLLDLDPEDENAYLEGDEDLPLATVARNAFLAAVGESFPLRDEAFYQLWNLAEGEGDTLDAVAWADSLIATTPRSLRAPEVRLTRARALLAQGKPSEAAQEAGLALPDRDTPELRWFLAECSHALGFPRQEAMQLEYLIANHSADPLALTAWNERLRLAGVDSALTLPPERRIQLQHALLVNPQSGALDSLRAMAADTALAPEVREDASLEVCRALIKRRAYDDAVPDLSALAGSGRPKVKTEAVLGLARIDRNTGRLDRMETRYREVIDGHGPEAARATWELGRELESQGSWARAEAVYSEGIDAFSASHRYRDMLFRRGFDRQRQGKLHAAAEDFRAAFAASRTQAQKEQATFWLARTLREQDREGAARSAARAGMAWEEPAGAYGVLLRERFGRVAPERPPVILDRQSLYDAIDSTAWPTPVSFHYERGLQLARMGQIEAARREWSRAADLGRRLPSLNQALALTAAAFNVYPEGVQWARRAEILLPTGHPLVPGFERLTYPPAYYGDVRREAVRRGLDPFAVWALMRQESYYDATAVSRAGALGLMQIMPGTLGRMTAETGLPPVPQDALFVPRVNITFGTQFLADRLDEFDHKLLPTLASYNAGESKCREWMDRAGGDASEVFIECIGYPETYDYVRRILWLKWVYQDYYGGPDPS